MNKITRIISVAILAAGMAFIVDYLMSQRGSYAASLSMPSYFVAKTYTFIFVSGAVGMFFAIIANFFAWMKKMDVKEDVLANAGFVSADERNSMVSGSTLDTATTTSIGCVKVDEDKDTATATEMVTDLDATEILTDEQAFDADATEILTDEQTFDADATEMIDENRGEANEA